MAILKFYKRYSLFNYREYPILFFTEVDNRTIIMLKQKSYHENLQRKKKGRFKHLPFGSSKLPAFGDMS